MPRTFGAMIATSRYQREVFSLMAYVRCATLTYAATSQLWNAGRWTVAKHCTVCDGTTACGGVIRFPDGRLVCHDCLSTEYER